MAIEPIQITEQSAVNLIEGIGSIGHWLQAVGAILVIWIVFQVVNFIVERKRLEELRKISEKLGNIEKSLSKKPQNTSLSKPKT